MAMCTGGVIISNHQRLTARTQALQFIQRLSQGMPIERGRADAPCDHDGGQPASGKRSASDSDSEFEPPTLVIITNSSDHTSHPADFTELEERERQLMAVETV